MEAGTLLRSPIPTSLRFLVTASSELQVLSTVTSIFCFRIDRFDCGIDARACRRGVGSPIVSPATTILFGACRYTSEVTLCWPYALFNRAVSGLAPVADASSSQSRADLLRFRTWVGCYKYSSRSGVAVNSTQIYICCKSSRG